jgi:hypothetical protein
VWEAIRPTGIRAIFHPPRALATVRTTLRPSAMTALPTSRSLFRSLLRARAVAFRGDAKALAASRTEIRKHFDVRPRARSSRRPDEPRVSRSPIPSSPPRAPTGVRPPRSRGGEEEDRGGRRGGEFHPTARRAGGRQRAGKLRVAGGAPTRGRRVRGPRRRPGRVFRDRFEEMSGGEPSNASVSIVNEITASRPSLRPRPAREPPPRRRRRRRSPTRP